MKQCRICSDIKPKSGFYKDASRKDGYSYVCKICQSALTDERRIQRKYGITKKQYEELKNKQEGKCALCDKKPVGVALAIDHCHDTGKIRGLLCFKCNSGLGLLGDTKESISRALVYLGD